VEDLEQLAKSKALQGDVRSVQATCRAGGSRRVKVETVERLCRKVLGLDPRELYGEGFERAWQHRGKRVNERVQSFDHCFSSPKSVSLLAAGGSDHTRRQVAEARADALEVGIGYLERHGIGVRRDHNGSDRHPSIPACWRWRSSTAKAAPATRSSTPTCWCRTPPKGRMGAGPRWTLIDCTPS
jgi:TrwC relaxase